VAGIADLQDVPVALQQRLERLGVRVLQIRRDVVPARALAVRRVEAVDARGNVEQQGGAEAGKLGSIEGPLQPGELGSTWIAALRVAEVLVVGGPEHVVEHDQVAVRDGRVRHGIETADPELAKSLGMRAVRGP
jgi:hypothetical protein